MHTPLSSLLGPATSTYTRSQALEDGVLVDASALARQAGIRFPVALTAAAWADCVAWTDEDSARTGAYQDEAGRLWDVVWMTRCAIVRGRGGDPSAVVVELYRVPRDGSSLRALETRLVAVCGPGDAGEPVITIFTKHEHAN